MRRFFLLPLLALAVFCLPQTPVSADTTYAVNLSGMDAENSHVLRVFGTITLDLTQPLTNQKVTSSSLQFQHQPNPNPADPPIALPPMPEFSPTANANLTFSDTAGTLNVVRTGLADSFIRWKAPSANLDVVFVLGSGTRTHNLNRQDNGSPLEVAVLNPNDANNGQTVFPIGVAVPEPSSAVVLMGIGALLVSRRRKTPAAK